jgi:hypothetical protein
MMATVPEKHKYYILYVFGILELVQSTRAKNIVMQPALAYHNSASAVGSTFKGMETLFMVHYIIKLCMFFILKLFTFHLTLGLNNYFL